MPNLGNDQKVIHVYVSFAGSKSIEWKIRHRNWPSPIQQQELKLRTLVMENSPRDSKKCKWKKSHSAVRLLWSEFARPVGRLDENCRKLTFMGQKSKWFISSLRWLERPHTRYSDEFAAGRSRWWRKCTPIAHQSNVLQLTRFFQCHI